jgi:TonB family protein
MGSEEAVLGYDWPAMRSVILIGAFLSAIFPNCAAGDTPAQQLLSKAMAQSDLFHDQAKPLQLDVDFSAQMYIPAQGHLTFKWEAKNRWWRKVVMGKFEETEIQNGEMHYVTRNAEFTPIRIGQLEGLLQFAEPDHQFQVKKEKKKRQNGMAVSCLRVEENAFHRQRREICLNEASQDIVSDDWELPPDEKRHEQFSDYFEFNGRHYPRKLELLVNGIKAVAATVVSLTEAPFDESLLVPPKGAIARRICEGMIQPRALKTPEPAYPRSASENKIMGDTIVVVTILEDGSVADIHLVGTAVRSMDEATLQTLKSWKFKPAMCGSEPVVSDLMVVVSFRLY